MSHTNNDSLRWMTIEVSVGVWWYVWAIKGFWWGVLYGMGWEIWCGYRLARYLLT